MPPTATRSFLFFFFFTTIITGLAEALDAPTAPEAAAAPTVTATAVPNPIVVVDPSGLATTPPPPSSPAAACCACSRIWAACRTPSCDRSASSTVSWISSSTCTMSDTRRESSGPGGACAATTVATAFLHTFRVCEAAAAAAEPAGRSGSSPVVLKPAAGFADGRAACTLSAPVAGDTTVSGSTPQRLARIPQKVLAQSTCCWIPFSQCSLARRAAFWVLPPSPVLLSLPPPLFASSFCRSLLLVR
mmetsp:Transcript_13195/g.27924  ORF Transcript_13195/g.27924 Transcript_13195/m.27924 type:complete len:246 (-) Transcript_13195:485-1222(-)